MPMIQTRRRFLTTLSVAGAAASFARRERWPPRGRSKRPPSALQKFPAICVAPSIRRRGAAARRGLYRCPLCGNVAGAVAEAIGHGKVDFSLNYASTFVTAIDAGEPITPAGRRACRLLRIVREGRHPQRRRSQGQERRRARLGVELTHVLVTLMAAQVGLDPAKDIHWVTDPSDQADRAVRGGEDRRLPRLSARAAGSARSPYRPRDRQQRRGPPVVAVFLLHAGGQPGIRAQVSGRDQARAARHPQGDRSLRHRAGARRATDRRWRFHRRDTTMRCRR